MQNAQRDRERERERPTFLKRVEEECQFPFRFQIFYILYIIIMKVRTTIKVAPAIRH